MTLTIIGAAAGAFLMCGGCSWLLCFKECLSWIWCILDCVLCSPIRWCCKSRDYRLVDEEDGIELEDTFV